KFGRCWKRIPKRINRTPNIPTTFRRCLRRMPTFEGLWLSCRTSFSETSPIKGENEPVIAMRLLLAAVIAASVVYFWDDSYNEGKFTDGLVKLAGSITRSNR